MNPLEIDDDNETLDEDPTPQEVANALADIISSEAVEDIASMPDFMTAILIAVDEVENAVKRRALLEITGQESDPHDMADDDMKRLQPAMTDWFTQHDYPITPKNALDGEELVNRILLEKGILENTTDTE